MPDPTKITTFLMFDGHAEEAITLYLSLFNDAELIELTRYGPDGPGPAGACQLARFSLGGQIMMATDSIVEHQIGHNPYLSLSVNCDSDQEIERLYRALSDNGQTPMPLGDYGFSAKFAWVTDRYGVPWQLTLPHPAPADR